MNLDGRIFKIKNFPEIRCCFPVGDDTSNGTAMAIYEGEFELDKVNFRPGDVVLDIGCNIGLLSCLIAKLYPYVTVYAIDANPLAYICTKINILNNQLLNVYALNVAIGFENRENVSFCATSKQPSASISFMYGPSEGHGEVTYCNQITMHELFNNKIFTIKNVKYCKIDIEGDEYKLMPDLIQNHPDILNKIEYMHLEIHNIKGKAQSFSEYINKNIGPKILNKNIFSIFK